MSMNDNVFKSRNFRLVFWGAVVSELGALLYSFAVSFYILEISGNSASLQGLYLAVCGAVMLVFTLIGGVLGDRYNKAKIMYGCDYLKGGLIFLATILMLIFKEPSAHIVILFSLGILGSVVSGIFGPAAGALFPHIIQEEQLQQANSYISMKSSLESILGVILAGVLYAALPIHMLFFFVGLCYIASGFSEMFIRYDHQPSGEQLTLRLAFKDIGEGFSYVKTRKAILALVISALFINFFFTPMTSNFIPFFIKTDIATASSYLFDKIITPELWSSVFSVCIGISTLFAAVILSSKPQEEKCGAKISVRLMIFSVFLILLTVCYWFLVSRGQSLNLFLVLFSLGLMIIGVLLTFINIPINTALMRIVDKDKLSKVSSMISIGTQGMIPIASALAGVTLDSLGSTFLLAVCSLGFTVTSILLLFNKHIKEL